LKVVLEDEEEEEEEEKVEGYRLSGTMSTIKPYGRLSESVIGPME